MSFGPSNTTKTAENNLSGTSNAALNTLFPAVTAAGGSQLGAGGSNVTAGTNFFNTLLQGNKANTTAMLQPNIDDIRANTSGTLSAINTLMPRSGGRSATLFDQSFQPQRQIQNLFNTGRTMGATALPQIGIQQQGLGANLFGIGNSALGTATGANSSLGSIGLTAQQMSDQRAAAIGSGIFGLATVPFGGGTAKNGLFGLLGSGK